MVELDVEVAHSLTLWAIGAQSKPNAYRLTSWNGPQDLLARLPRAAVTALAVLMVARPPLPAQGRTSPPRHGQRLGRNYATHDTALYLHFLMSDRMVILTSTDGQVRTRS